MNTCSDCAVAEVYGFVGYQHHWLMRIQYGMDSRKTDYLLFNMA